MLTNALILKQMQFNEITYS